MAEHGQRNRRCAANDGEGAGRLTSDVERQHDDIHRASAEAQQPP